MREVQIIAWCDGHGPERIPAVATVAVALNGEAREVDLCDPCAEALEALLGPLVAAGRVPEPPPRRRTGPPVSSGAADRDTACPECNRTFKTSGLPLHRSLIHGIKPSRRVRPGTPDRRNA